MSYPRAEKMIDIEDPFQRKLYTALRTALAVCLRSDNRIKDYMETHGSSFQTRRFYDSPGEWQRTPIAGEIPVSDQIPNAWFDVTTNTLKFINNKTKWQYHIENPDKMNSTTVTICPRNPDRNPSIDTSYMYSQFAVIAKTLVPIERRHGNCGDRTFIAAKYLWENAKDKQYSGKNKTGDTQKEAEQNINRIEGVSMETFDHILLVVNRKDPSDLDDPDTWGDDCWVIDPWYKDGVVFPAKDYPAMLKEIKQFAEDQGKLLAPVGFKFKEYAKTSVDRWKTEFEIKPDIHKYEQLIGKKVESDPTTHPFEYLNFSDLYRHDNVSSGKYTPSLIHQYKKEHHDKFFAANTSKAAEIIETGRLKKPSTLLHLAAQEGDFTKVYSLIEGGKDVNAMENGVTPLFLAAQAGQHNIVKLLLANGAKINEPNGKNKAAALHVAIANGYNSIARTLKRHGADISQKCADGATPLYIAAESGQLASVKMLLKKGVDVNASLANSTTPLMAAIVNGNLEVVNELLKVKGLQVNAEHTTDKNTALHLAAASERADITEALLEHGATLSADQTKKMKLNFKASLLYNAAVKAALSNENVMRNVITADGKTLGEIVLAVAIARGDAETMLALMKHDVIYTVIPNRDTPLITAARANKRELFDLLMTKGVDVNIAGETGVTALIVAARNGHLDITTSLLNKGADISATDGQGNTALIWAAANGHLQIVTSLLANGAAINQSTKECGTPLFYAVKKGHLDIVNFLLEQGANFSTTLITESMQKELLPFLFEEVKKGNLDILKLFMEKGIDINLADSNGNTALIWAAAKGQDHIVEFLLTKGANPNAATLENDTALTYALKGKHFNVAKILIGKGVDINAEQKNGPNALCQAAQDGKSDEVIALLDLGVKINTPGESGSTALWIAAKNGHVDVVKTLLNNGAQLGDMLINAAYQEEESIVKTLLDAGVDINSRNEYGDTALHKAALRQNFSIVELLLIRNADPNPINNAGLTPYNYVEDYIHSGICDLLQAKGGTNLSLERESLLVAAKNGDMKKCMDLIAMKININNPGKEGKSPLIIATEAGQHDIIKFLLINKADVNITSNDKRETALHIAMETKQIDIIETLLANGANISAKNNDDITPLSIAKTNNSLGILIENMEKKK